MDIIIDVFQFFIKEDDNLKEKDEFFISEFQTALELYKSHDENQFFKDILIFSLYENVKSKSLLISDILNNQSLSLFLNEFNSFLKEFELNYKDKISKYNDVISKITNANGTSYKTEDISYLIGESITEIDRAKITSYSNGKEKTHPIVRTLYNDKIKITDLSDVFSELQNKPFGFYIASITSTFSFYESNLHAYYLISKQENGISTILLKDTTEMHLGWSNARKQVSNVFNKKHSIDLLNINNNNELSTFVDKNKKHFNSFINEIVLKLSISLFAENINLTQNIGNISYNEKKIKLPVVFESKITNQKELSFDDVRFSGKYDFLAFIDDYFEDVIKMELVNFRKETNKSHLFHKMETKNPNLWTRNFDRDSFHQFEIKSANFENLGLGDHRGNNYLTSIPNIILGTEKENEDLILRIAKANKEALYFVYINHFFKTHSKDYINEIKSFIVDNSKELLEDQTFLKFVGDVNISKNNKNALSEINRHPIFSFVSTELEIESEYSTEQHKSFKDIDKKTKAQNLLNLNFKELHFLAYLQKEYGLVLSDESLFLSKLLISSKKLQSERNKFKKIHMPTLFNLKKSNIDIELAYWMLDVQLIKNYQNLLI